MSFTGTVFQFESEFCKLGVSMALLQMGCSHKHYIMSLNHSKHKKTMKLKWGKKASERKRKKEGEQDTHTSAPSPLKQTRHTAARAGFRVFQHLTQNLKRKAKHDYLIRIHFG